MLLRRYLVWKVGSKFSLDSEEKRKLKKTKLKEKEEEENLKNEI